MPSRSPGGRFFPALRIKPSATRKNRPVRCEPPHLPLSGPELELPGQFAFWVAVDRALAGYVNNLALQPVPRPIQAVIVFERRVVVVVYAGALALDITGPIEVFDTANRLLASP